MNYVEHVNGLLRDRIGNAGRLAVYGQNVCAGSCIGGLMRGIVSAGEVTVVNTPNTENGLVGLGMGLMLRGVSAIYAMKQHDFMLLGVDQLANTAYVLRRHPLSASFTMLTVVVDSGYEGPQSALNNLSELCSIARLPCYTITNRDDAALVVDRHLVAPGIRIIAVSQRLFRTPIIAGPEFKSCDRDGGISQHDSGERATIVCFNFSFPQGLDLCAALKARGIDADLFSVNAVHPTDYGEILASAKRTQRLVVLDDSKSVNRTSHQLLLVARGVCDWRHVLYLERPFDDGWFRPNPDSFEVDLEKVLQHTSPQQG